ncbi:dihydrofolate reductase family protein [soil metagenome]
MTRTTYYTATTLDGYIADQHDSLDWLFVQEHDPDGPMSHARFMAGVGAMVMGATTYRWILDHMAGAGEEGGRWEYEIPCWVMTHRELRPLDGADIRIAAADDDGALRRVHADMVAAAGEADIWVVGGGALAADLADLGLLDEVVVSIAPVTLGTGRPLLPRPLDLRLIELERNGAFACGRYAVEGPRPGSGAAAG